VGRQAVCGLPVEKGARLIMSGNAIELTDATFDEVVNNSDQPVLVDFWATWCGPCKMMSPIIEDLATDYTGRAKICKLNTDEARDSAIEFGISAIPTLLLFKDGHVKRKWVGLTSKKELSEALDGLL
jgi:thioredoxin 1